MAGKIVSIEEMSERTVRVQKISKKIFKIHKISKKVLRIEKIRQNKEPSKKMFQIFKKLSQKLKKTLKKPR